RAYGAARRASRATLPRPARSRCSDRAPRSPPRARRGSDSCRLDELPLLRPDPAEQLLEGIGELLHALLLERGDDVLVLDAGLRQLIEQLPRLAEALLERQLDLAVILEGDDRLLGHRVHRVGSDKTIRSEEHTSELQSRGHLVCRLLLEKKKKKQRMTHLVSMSALS